MAKVTIKGVENVKNNIKKLFDEVRKDTKMLLEIGEKTVELTQGFNRAGSSPAQNLGKKRHPINSKAWEQRKNKLTATNNASEFYRFGLSNVTFTGQLLESIGIIKLNSENSGIEIAPTKRQDKRKPYKNLQGVVTDKAKENTPTNTKLIGYLKEKGRFIFGINRQIQNNINRIVRRYLNDRIKKLNK